MTCERCWGEAWSMSQNSTKSQVTIYYELLEQKKDCPCSPQEQAGDYWDEELQIDTRLLNKEVKVNE